MTTTADTTEIGAALEARDKKAKPEVAVRDLIDRMRPELVKSLQDEGAAERLARHYYTAIRLNPKLLACTSESLLGGLLLSAQLDLDPGPLGHVYLVPYKDECVWMLGYTGIIELARRTGRVAGLSSEIVWDCDEYVPPWRDEKGLHYLHKPGPVDKRKDRRGVLVAWKELPGRFAMGLDVPLSRIDRARAASQTASKGVGPWKSDEDAMWRKTGIRAARPFLPLTVEMARAVTVDGARVIGVDVEDDTAVPALDAPEANDDA